MSGKTTDPDSGCLAINGPPEVRRPGLLSAAGFTLAYVLFALGCVAALVAAAWLRWFERDPGKRVARLRSTVSMLCRWYLEYHSALGLISVEYTDQRRLGPGLIVANHPSLVDALWILATQPHICCVLKGDLQESWLFRALVEQLNYVSNRDPEQLLSEGSRRLRAGETLLVFAEATRTTPQTMPRFRLGAAELVVRSGAAIHPVVIHKRGSYLSKSRAWHQFPSHRLIWQIDFAPSIQPAVGGDPRRARRRITADLQCYFHRCLDAGTVAQRPEPTEN